MAQYFPHARLIEIVLVGKVGCGKSASGNTILRREVFESSFCSSAVTKTCKRETGQVCGNRVALLDTPGLDCAEVSSDELIWSLWMNTQRNINVFLLVIQLGRFTEEQRAAVQRTEDLFGERAREFTMILFTYGDHLKRTPIEDFLRKAGVPLRQVVEKYDDRYHVFNNESGAPSQVTELFDKINRMQTVIQHKVYQMELPLGMIGREMHIGQRPMEELRIFLVGKTGAGKSASGNTILGENVFKSVMSAVSQTSNCEKARGKVAEQWVAVIDTPGVFDTNYTKREAMIKISECMCLSAPGPHVFLIVTQLGRFTPEEKETLKILQTTFGEQAENYTMVLFTHGDQLGDTSIEGYMRESPELQRLVAKCNNMYHVFNNKDQNPSQVTELLKKINKMVMRNGGSHYTNEMFQETEKAIQEEEKRILKENEEKRCKEIEELKKNLEGEALKEATKNLDEKYKRKARILAEKINRFIKATGGGALAGGAIGARMGPAGVVVGVVVGGVVGGVAGGLTGAGIINVSEKCSIQ